MTYKASSFLYLLKQQGINFFSGVPCSILTGIISELIEDDSVTYISSTREDEAIGIASGAYMAGKLPAVLMQNSGIGNSLNALSSHNLIYKIPCLLLVSWRGYKGKDAPEHLISGAISEELLNVAGIPSFTIENENIEDVTISAIQRMKDKSIPVAILIKNGVIG